MHDTHGSFRGSEAMRSRTSQRSTYAAKCSCPHLLHAPPVSMAQRVNFDDESASVLGTAAHLWSWPQAMCGARRCCSAWRRWRRRTGYIKLT